MKEIAYLDYFSAGMMDWIGKGKRRHQARRRHCPQERQIGQRPVIVESDRLNSPFPAHRLKLYPG